MPATWRLLDTGLRSATENIALNRALLEERQMPEGRSSLRFLQFTPSALLGFHQSAEQELNLEYCRAQGITVQRRLTGGGAIYFDTDQLGWELYLHKREAGGGDMRAIAQRICLAAARGLSTLGLTAQFRPRNDIEVEGKKISGTGGCFDGEALLYQGSLLLRLDVDKMLRVLRIPAEKLADKAIASVRERLTSLYDLLGFVPELSAIKSALRLSFAETFDVEFEPATLSRVEETRYATAVHEIDSAAWILQNTRPATAHPVLMAMQKFPAGLVRATIAYDARGTRIKQVWFTGDFFVTPRRAVLDLEAYLRDTPSAELGIKIQQFFAQYPHDLMGLKPENFVAVVHAALDLPVVIS